MSGYLGVYGTNEGCTGGGISILYITVIPPIIWTGPVVIGEVYCGSAYQTIYVGGVAGPVTIIPGGSATFIAGQNIICYPGTSVLPGGYMHGYIAPAGPWCGAKSATIITVPQGDTLVYPAVEKSFFTLYPNPTTGNFILEQKGETLFGNIKVDVYGMRGEKLLSEIGRAHV